MTAHAAMQCLSARYYQAEIHEILSCLACADAQSMPPALSDASDGSGRGSSESQHQRSDLLPELPSAGLLRPLQRRASAPPGQLLDVMELLAARDTAELSGLLLLQV